MEEYNGKIVSDEYITKDLMEVAYLSVCHYPYSTYRDGTIMLFKFKIISGNTDLLINLLKKFHNKNTRVDAKCLLEAFKSAKISIHSTNYNPNYYGEKHRESHTNEKDGGSDNKS